MKILQRSFNKTDFRKKMKNRNTKIAFFFLFECLCNVHTDSNSPYITEDSIGVVRMENNCDGVQTGQKQEKINSNIRHFRI